MTLPFVAPAARARAWLGSEAAKVFAARATPWLVFAIALWVRLDFVSEHEPSRYVIQDMAFYDASARRLLAGTQTAWDTFTPVGYPAVLAAVYRTLGEEAIGPIQAFVGALGCVLACVVSRRFVRGLVGPLVVGLMMAFYLPLILYSGLLMTEIWSSTVILAFVWLTARASERRSVLDAVAAGLAFGIGCAMRPNLAIAIPLFALLCVVKRTQRSMRSALAVASVAALIPISFASIDQSTLVGRPAFLATNGGVNFFLGHCECRAIRFPTNQNIVEVAGRHNRVRYTELAEDAGPAYDDAHLYRRAVALIAKDPVRLIRDVSSIGDGLGLGDDAKEPPFWPGWMGHDDELRLQARLFLWLALVPATLLGACRMLGAAERRTRSLAAIVRALLLSLLATMYLFLGDARIRLSFDPLILVMAVEAWKESADGARRGLRRRRIGKAYER